MLELKRLKKREKEKFLIIEEHEWPSPSSFGLSPDKRGALSTNLLLNLSINFV